jgi:cyclic pyranopterin phosphate synthase
VELTHIDKNGKAVMVDVSQKTNTKRTAIARAFVKMKPQTLNLILTGSIKKGDVFTCSRIAGFMAAKHTSDIIPLCHSTLLTNISLDINPQPPNIVEIIATVKCTYVTGVEMEALCAASVAALTIYDMCKAVDRGIEITSVQLLKKSGGKSGEYKRSETENLEYD